MQISTKTTAGQMPWLRGGLYFEAFFLGGTALFSLFVLLLLDAGLLSFVGTLGVYSLLVAQPHFVSTYARTSFEKKNLRQNIFIIGILPVLIFGALLGLYSIFGIWIYMSLYMYVQWFHFTRQSYGVARFYRAKNGAPLTDDLLTTLVVYAVPLWGILRWSMRQPETYVGLPVKTFDVPAAIDPYCAAIVYGLVLLWAVGRFRQWRAGVLPIPHTIYVVTHIVMFLACYVYVQTLEYGWLAIGLWHSLQYLIFVWALNEQKRQNIEKGPLKNSLTFFEKISSLKLLPVYALLLFCASFLLFSGFQMLGDSLQQALIVPALIVVGTIIFHHYATDAIIWRRPKKRSPAPAGNSA
ncbi:MAG TPA: hypothetical protein PLX33_05505 [Alphaproteobacteria bacterium]|nr:hypothetical protein [Alphaproteobacteria bacterium]